MALRRRNRLEYPSTVSTFNQTNDMNPSHLVDPETNYFLRDISLENIDQCVFEAFHRRFKINSKELNLISLDADVASMRFENPQSFDTGKQFLNFPYFTYWRSASNPWTRTSNMNRPTTYIVPKKLPQGVVYTEYIVPPPVMLKLNYTFKFITTYREHLNEFETQMLEYFKNKRNLVVWDNERFEIMPNEQFVLGSLETVDREGSIGQSMYVVTYELQVIAYTRDSSKVMKRERPNTYSLQVSERSGPVLTTISHTESRIPTNGIDDKIP